jgi:hypothetical protein
MNIQCPEIRMATKHQKRYSTSIVQIKTVMEKPQHAHQVGKKH